MVTGRWRRTGLAVAAAALPVLFATAASSGGPERGPLPVVYLSGLDDHLLPAYDAVPVYDSPGGRVTATAPAGSLARVNAERGEWLDVSIPATGVRGWIADFYLRGELRVVNPQAPACPVVMRHSPGGAEHGHILEPSTAVRLVDLAQLEGTTWVLVREVASDRLSWVEQAALSEAPGPDIRRAAAGTDCAQLEAEPVIPHHH